MHEAGAKFGGICLVHHDGFLLWDSKVNRWNSATMGPKRDIYGEIAAAVRKYDDMKLLATFHHGRSFGYTKSAPPAAKRAAIGSMVSLEAAIAISFMRANCLNMP